MKTYLDAGDLGREGQVRPALDGEAPLLLEVVPLQHQGHQLLRHLDSWQQSNEVRGG